MKKGILKRWWREKSLPLRCVRKIYKGGNKSFPIQTEKSFLNKGQGNMEATSLGGTSSIGLGVIKQK
jgi:hypothetical protein